MVRSDTIWFFVPGEPQSKGSMKGFPIRRSNGKTGVVMTNSNAKTTSWENTVLAVIRRYGPITDRAIAAKLEKECGFVSARRNALEAKGLVREAGYIEDPLTHHAVTLWQVVA